MLISVCALIGFRNPNTLQIIAVSEFIRKDFGFLTADQVKRAFELNATGKYWETIGFFQSFDIQFVGSVLGEFVKAWRKKKAKDHNKRSLQAKKLNEELNEKPITKERAQEWIEKMRNQIGDKKENKYNPEEPRPESSQEHWLETIFKPMISSLADNELFDTQKKAYINGGFNRRGAYESNDIDVLNMLDFEVEKRAIERGFNQMSWIESEKDKNKLNEYLKP